VFVLRHVVLAGCSAFMASYILKFWSYCKWCLWGPDAIPGLFKITLTSLMLKKINISKRRWFLWPSNSYGHYNQLALKPNIVDDRACMILSCTLCWFLFFKKLLISLQEGGAYRVVEHLVNCICIRLLWLWYIGNSCVDRTLC